MATAVELITRYYAEFNRRSYTRMLDLMCDDVAHDINQGGREVGRAAFAKFLAHMDRCYAEQVENLVVFVAPNGNRGAAEFEAAGKYLQTDPGFPEAKGQSYRVPAGAFFELRDDKIARVTTYYNVKQWLQQIEK